MRSGRQTAQILVRHSASHSAGHSASHSASLATGFGVCALLGLAVFLPVQALAASHRVVESFSIGTGIEDLSISADGGWVALVESATGEVRFMDTRLWNDPIPATCSGSLATSVVLAGDTGSVYAFVGCEDGNVIVLDVSSTSFTEVARTDATLSEAGIGGLALDATNSLLYAVARSVDGSSKPEVYALDVADPLLPVNVGFDGKGSPGYLNDATFMDVDLASGYLIATHGSAGVSKMDLGTGNSASESTMSGSRNVTDIAVAGGMVYLADESQGNVVKFNVGTNEYSYHLDDLESVSALTFLDDDDAIWLALYESTAAQIYIYSVDGTYNFGPDPELTFDANASTEMVGGSGYIFSGGAELEIVTDRPWVEVVSAPKVSTIHASGDLVTLGFQSDTAGDYSVVVDGLTISGLPTGSVEVDATEEATFEVTDEFPEGDAVVCIEVEAQGLTGHDCATVFVDNPPGKVELTDAGVSFGNQKVIISFTALTDEDIDHYDIYVSTEPFSASDYVDGGGPEFTGVDAIETPLVLTAFEPGSEASYEIYPLTNFTTYYVAVRATDTGKKEGLMSDVVSEMPRPTSSASGLAGEQGGYCGATGMGATMLGLGAGMLAVLARRKRALGVASGLLLGTVLLVPVAQAEEGDKPKADLQVRYGPYSYQDPWLTTVYGEPKHGILVMEGGVRFARVLELNAGTGFYQKVGWLVADDGGTYVSSGEHSMITAFPFTAGARLRLDFFHDQIIVPWANAGFDYWLWKENWFVDDPTTQTDRISGGKAGYHWAIGGSFLLDRLDPSQASKLAAHTPIKDTYLTMEWRNQKVGQWAENGGLSFDGTSLTFGVELSM